MNVITVKEILEATGGTLLCGGEDTPVTGLCIDSRSVRPGDLFVPFVGERVDGHRFISQVLKDGAAASLTERAEPVIGQKPVIRIPNSKLALQQIGSCYRQKLSLPFVGVTGSVGKTTVRQMIATALSGEFQVFCTKKNYNGQIGLPLTLSEIQESDEMAVLEMGISLPGEMERISRIACVDLAVVTNIGVSHLEYLGSREGICKEKLRITDGMPSNGRLLIYGDDDLLPLYAPQTGKQVLTYGTGEGHTFRAAHIRQSRGRWLFDFCHNGQSTLVQLQVPGVHNVLNATAAIATAVLYGVPAKNAAKALETYTGFQHRLQLCRAENFTVIDDSYNASPDSMKAALNVLASQESTGKKIAVLGDMLELGELENQFHYEIGLFAADLKIDTFYLIGKRARQIGAGILQKRPKAAIAYFDQQDMALAHLRSEAENGAVLLFKGSQAMGLGAMIDKLMEK